MTSKLLWAAGLAVCLGGGAGGVAAQDVYMTPKEIQDTLIGRELHGSNARGMRFISRLDESGKVLGGAQEGTWRLSDDGYCTRFERRQGGKEVCFRVVKEALLYRVLDQEGTLIAYINSVR